MHMPRVAHRDGCFAFVDAWSSANAYAHAVAHGSLPTPEASLGSIPDLWPYMLPTPLPAAEGLCGTFETWLAAMGFSHVVGAQLERLQSLWAQAKEAAALQGLVASLKESELELARVEAEDAHRHMDTLVRRVELLLRWAAPSMQLHAACAYLWRQRRPAGQAHARDLARLDVYRSM
jgi:hypothetical protein